MVKKILARSILFAILAFCTIGCQSTQRRQGDGELDYVRPTSVAEADYAIRERIRSLELQLADAQRRADALEGRIEGAQELVVKIRESGTAIRELSRRSAEDVQGIIEQMESLILWIDWATGRIQYLESILAGEVQNTNLVED